MRPSFPRVYRGFALLIFLPMLLISGKHSSRTPCWASQRYSYLRILFVAYRVRDFKHDGNLGHRRGSHSEFLMATAYLTVLLANGAGFQIASRV